jgi:hypothetical protein
LLQFEIFAVTVISQKFLSFGHCSLETFIILANFTLLELLHKFQKSLKLVKSIASFGVAEIHLGSLITNSAKKAKEQEGD